MQEVWQPARGYEGFYEVSNQGRVKSLARWSCEGKGRRWISEHILKPVIVKDGYTAVGIKGKQLKVHRLVMEAFMSPVPVWATMINHIDKNPANNKLTNLEWSHNGHNKRHANRKYIYKNNLYCLTELYEICGISIARLHSRIHYLGWPVAKAVETPIKTTKHT
jgi:hypothetical protein